jgi:WD40 repeat protein
MFEGVYWVAISGDGNYAAAAGWYSDGRQPTQTAQGLLKIYDATTGDVLLNYPSITTRVNAIALSSDGSLAAAIAGNNIYVFAAQGGVYNQAPTVISLGANTPQAISVHPSGDWLVASDNQGTVYLTVNPGNAPQQTYQWPNPNAVISHSVAIGGASDYFVACADDGNVYLFEHDSFIATSAPLAQATITPNAVIRWVAAAATIVGGTFPVSITAVCNDGKTGVLAGIGYRGESFEVIWQEALSQMPNCTSIDAQGRYVAAADGYNGPGDFYLYDAPSGELLGTMGAPDMCWPMFVSANGNAIAAGSDDGMLYYFSTSI